jgi:arylsulfatase A-like enzyme
MRFFDQALEDFRAALAADGLLDDVVLMVFGDHDAGFAHDPELARAIGIPPSEAGWAVADRVPLVLRAPGVFDEPPGARHTIGTPMGQSDFAPTLLALLGIDAASLPYVGRNVLGQPDDPPVLRPYGDWVDHMHLFLNRGTAEQIPVCYETSPLHRVDAQACDPANRAAVEARRVSSIVVTDDLQERVAASLKQGAR